MTEPVRVLYVCTANICRSPFMELLTTSWAMGALQASSAGTHAQDGLPIDPAMTRTLAPLGPRADGFASRRVTGDLVDDADVVLTAELAHRRFVLEEHPAAFRKVFTLGQFAAAATAEEVTGLDLLDSLGSRRPAADPALDVGDPYRRGPRAATACGDTLTRLLGVVVPALTGSGRIST